MTNTRPHYLYSDIVNSIKADKATIIAMTGLLDGTLAYATDTNELGTYDAISNTWTWLGAGALLYIQDEGVPVGTPNTLNFVGQVVDVSVSGSVARVFITGSGSSPLELDGWNTSNHTWTYLNSDAPSYVVSVNANVTGTIGVGMKTQLTHQSIAKNFIVTAVSVTGSTSYLNLYGGTDYTLNVTGSITNPKYSNSKSPFGFPTDPIKWTVTLSDSSQRSQASPVANTKYNLGSLSISIPIGSWLVSWKTFLEGDINGTAVSVYATLSTANNSESDSDFTGAALNVGANAADFRVLTVQSVFKYLTLSTKTTYFHNCWTTTASVTRIYFRGDLVPTLVKAVCAYL